MRPAIEAGLMLFSEAVEAYMRQLLKIVSSASLADPIHAITYAGG
jgi:hypothetical protein